MKLAISIKNSLTISMLFLLLCTFNLVEPASANDNLFTTDTFLSYKTFLINSAKKNRANIDSVIEKSKILRNIKNKTDEEKILLNAVYSGYIFQACHLETVLYESLNYISKINNDSIESSPALLSAMTVFIGGQAYNVCDGIIGTSEEVYKLNIKEVNDMIKISKEYKTVFKKINNIYNTFYKEKKLYE